MNEDKKMTVSQWNDLEKEKLADVQAAKSELENLDIKRGDLLLSFSEGRADKKDIEAIEKRVKELNLEIEATQSLLKAIPQRRNLAQADELEVTIRELEGLSNQMDQLKPEIDAAAETFVLSLRKFFDIQEALIKINPHSITYQTHEQAVLNSLGVALRKHDLFRYIKVGDYRNPELMTGKKTAVEKSAGSVIHMMQEHVKALRSGNDKGLDFCQKCYGILGYANEKSNKRICMKCGAVAGEA